MSLRCLAPFLAMTACAPDPLAVPWPDAPPDVEQNWAVSPTPVGPTWFETDPVLSGNVTTWSGLPLDDAALCTVEGCSPTEDSYGQVVLPDGEVDVRVSAEHTLVRHLQVVGSADQHIVVPTPAEADAIAAWFDVERKPGMGILFQPVETFDGVTPELSVEADGPYFLDGRRWPMVDAESAHFGSYVFFNVPPGLHAVHLPGCDEGEDFWGAPHDGSIDLEMAPDAWLGLSTLRCDG